MFKKTKFLSIILCIIVCCATFLSGCSGTASGVLDLKDIMSNAIKAHNAVNSFTAKGTVDVDAMVHMPKDIGGDQRLQIFGDLDLIEVNDKVYTNQSYSQNLLEVTKETSMRSYLMPQEDTHEMIYTEDKGETWKKLDVKNYEKENFVSDILDKFKSLADIESKLLVLTEGTVEFNGRSCYELKAGVSGDLIESYINLFLFSKSWINSIDFNMLSADVTLYLATDTKDVMGVKVSCPSFGDYLLSGTLSKSIIDAGTTWEITSLTATFEYNDFNNAADITLPKGVSSSATRVGTLEGSGDGSEPTSENSDEESQGIGLNNDLTIEEQSEIMSAVSQMGNISESETEIDVENMPLPERPTEDAIYMIHSDPNNIEQSYTAIITDIPESNTITAQEDYIAIINDFENKGQENLYYDYSFENRKLSDAVEAAENVVWMSSEDGYTNIVMGQEQVMNYNVRVSLTDAVEEKTLHYVKTEYDYDDGTAKIHHLQYSVYIDLGNNVLFRTIIDNHGERVSSKKDESIIGVIMDHVVLLPYGSMVSVSNEQAVVAEEGNDDENVTNTSAAGQEPEALGQETPNLNSINSEELPDETELSLVLQAANNGDISMSNSDVIEPIG